MSIVRSAWLSIPLLSISYSVHAVDKERLKELAQKYAPILYLHPDEPYQPTSMENQLSYLALYKKGSEEPLMKNLTMEDFESFVQSTNDTENYQLKIARDTKNARAGNVKEARCYTNPHLVQFKNKTLIQIPYLFYYGYNGIPHSKNCVIDCIIKKHQLGVHEGDWEGIVVLLDQNENIYGVHYSAHGYGEARFYKKEGSRSLRKDDGYKLQDGRPMVFSALETHASYNRVGNLTRRAHKNLKEILASKLHILPPDRTGVGAKLDCKEPGKLEDFNLESEKTWAAFKGNYGGPTGPGGKDFWFGPLKK